MSHFGILEHFRKIIGLLINFKLFRYDFNYFDFNFLKHVLENRKSLKFSGSQNQATLFIIKNTRRGHKNREFLNRYDYGHSDFFKNVLEYQNGSKLVRGSNLKNTFILCFSILLIKSEGQKIFHLRALRLFGIYKFSFLLRNYLWTVPDRTRPNSSKYTLIATSYPISKKEIW